jgi:hypothetical protein
MSATKPADLETDPRFPSGPWVGFFIQKFPVPGRHQMELMLTFGGMQMTGEGRDYVGKFLIHGRYDTADGRCRWTKRYIGKHDVFYQGFNEGKGIWGTWEIPGDVLALTGGFHIWPKSMADPTNEGLYAAADLPAEVTEGIEIIDPAKELIGVQS